MLKTISTTVAWAGAWTFTAVSVWAGNANPPPPPAVDTDSGNNGLLLLVVLGAVIFAAAKVKPKVVDDGGPDIVDAEEGAGNGKY